ncbi:8067_t:CDS:2 [Scutellospora calospora]|uniref:8067_t:CDS:1 n=1 Tax=Scutellospora calospora TaxID=85575 RepID=A0ACA9JW03_9GLOM|nr:8067_t:CDS:2 [Scutellospora calospora]
MEIATLTNCPNIFIDIINKITKILLNIQISLPILYPFLKDIFNNIEINNSNEIVIILIEYLKRILYKPINSREFLYMPDTYIRYILENIGLEIITKDILKCAIKTKLYISEVFYKFMKNNYPNIDITEVVVELYIKSSALHYENKNNSNILFKSEFFYYWVHCLYTKYHNLRKVCYEDILKFYVSRKNNDKINLRIIDIFRNECELEEIHVKIISQSDNAVFVYSALPYIVSIKLRKIMIKHINCKDECPLVGYPDHANMEANTLDSPVLINHK